MMKLTTPNRPKAPTSQHRTAPRKALDKFLQLPATTQIALIICTFGVLVLAGCNPPAAEAMVGFILAIYTVINHKADTSGE